MGLSRNFKKSYEIDGVAILVSVAPCSYMYSLYPLTLWVEGIEGGPNLGRGTADSKVSLDNATEADVDEAVSRIRFPKCKKKGCEGRFFDHPGTNREGLCETCFLEKANARIAKAMEREAKQEARRDEKKKAQGFTRKVVAWIHPEGGGDDYQIEIYSQGEMPEKEIMAIIARRKSSVTNDYRVLEL